MKWGCRACTVSKLKSRTGPCGASHSSHCRSFKHLLEGWKSDLSWNPFCFTYWSYLGESLSRKSDEQWGWWLSSTCTTDSSYVIFLYTVRFQKWLHHIASYWIGIWIPLMITDVLLKGSSVPGKHMCWSHLITKKPGDTHTNAFHTEAQQVNRLAQGPSAGLGCNRFTRLGMCVSRVYFPNCGLFLEFPGNIGMWYRDHRDWLFHEIGFFSETFALRLLITFKDSLGRRFTHLSYNFWVS